MALVTKPLLAIAIAVTATAPCLWDSDTLDTELRGLPDAFDLVVGRWHRHGDAYYQERVDRLAGRSDLALAEFDDLAVACEHLDRRDDAIAAMQAKAAVLATAPDEEHRYRYHANLGTFFAHAGRFDEALVELRRAVAINPDAHFGREVFQIELIEYVAAAKADPVLWTESSFLRHAGYRLGSYSQHIALPDISSDGQRELSWERAYEGVGGMLRFGGLEGPELYRTLGELFLEKGHLNLAWWAFGHAIERGHPARQLLQQAQAQLEAHWDDARPHDDTGHVNPTAEDYVRARADADRWLAVFQRAEGDAIARGDDVTTDAALRELLAIADRAVPRSIAQPTSWRKATMWSLIAASLLVLVVLLRLRSRA